MSANIHARNMSTYICISSRLIDMSITPLRAAPSLTTRDHSRQFDSVWIALKADLSSTRATPVITFTTGKTLHSKCCHVSLSATLARVREETCIILDFTLRSTCHLTTWWMTFDLLKSRKSRKVDTCMVTSTQRRVDLIDSRDAYRSKCRIDLELGLSVQRSKN